MIGHMKFAVLLVLSCFGVESGPGAETQKVSGDNQEAATTIHDVTTPTTSTDTTKRDINEIRKQNAELFHNGTRLEKQQIVEFFNLTKGEPPTKIALNGIGYTLGLNLEDELVLHSREWNIDFFFNGTDFVERPETALGVWKSRFTFKRSGGAILFLRNDKFTARRINKEGHTEDAEINNAYRYGQVTTLANPAEVSPTTPKSK